jgi:hypothetical protein
MPVSRNIYMVIYRKKSTRLYWQVEEAQHLVIMVCIGVFGLFGGGVSVLVIYLTRVSFAFALGTCRPLGYMHAPNLGVRGGFVCVLDIFGAGLCIWGGVSLGWGLVCLGSVVCVLLGRACACAYVGIRGMAVWWLLSCCWHPALCLGSGLPWVTELG